MLRKVLSTVLLSWCIVACGTSSAAADNHSTAGRAIRRSDVVFMYDNPEMYEPYGCTVMGWAGGRNKKRIDLAHSKGVRHFSCSVGFLTEGRGVIDFSEDFLDAACRNFAGEPFAVPWLWDHKHKGQSYWWSCTNSPLYEKYLTKRLQETMAAGPDGLHIDDYRGTSGSLTWLSGGFCRHCMAGFREYLSQEVSKEKGTHWYTGPVDEYAHLYRFVHDNGRLFDDYQAVAPVAVVYDNGANRKGRGRIEPICVSLAERNIPYTVLIAGDDWLDYRLDAQRLDRFKAVVLATDTKSMAPEQAQLIDKVAADGRIVNWPDDEKLAKLVPSPIRVDGSDRVMVVPRIIPGDAEAPAMVHLLNRQYDGPNDALVPQNDITVGLRDDLFAGRRFSKATLHAPKSQPIELETSRGDGRTSIKIPKLGLWTIIELNR